jgi:Transposase, Mutator family
MASAVLFERHPLERTVRDPNPLPQGHLHGRLRGGAAGALGLTSTCTGANAISQPSACTSGSTASTCRPGSRTTRSACWSSLSTPEGKKDFVGLIDGVRESAQSWKELLLNLKRRGLAIGPELAIADGGLGFWQAIEEVWRKTHGQRCWVHKTAPAPTFAHSSQTSEWVPPPFRRRAFDWWLAQVKHALPPTIKISVSGSAKVPGWESWKTLVSVRARKLASQFFHWPRKNMLESRAAFRKIF